MAAPTKIIQPVLLQKHQAGDEVTAKDLNQIQDNIDRALRQLQATPILNQQISTGAIGSSSLADGSILNKHVNAAAGINGTKLGANTIARDRIVPNTLTDNEIDPAANINGSKLLALSVDSTQLKDNAVIGTKIQALAVDGGVHIKTGTVTKTQILTGTITSTQIDPAANITGGQLSATAGLVGSQIANGTLTEANVLAGTLTNASISATADINGTKLLANSLPAAKLVGNSIGNAQLALTGLDVSIFTTGTLGGARVGSGIDAGNVTTGSLALARLAAGALPTGAGLVTVADANFTGTLLASKVANGLVAAQITSVNPSALTGSGTIPSAAIADGSITGGTAGSGVKLAAATVTGANVASAAINDTHLDPSLTQGFKYKAAVAYTPTTDGTLNPWGTKVLDSGGAAGASVFSGGTFTPSSSTFGRIHAVLQIRGSAITPGCRAYVYLMEGGVVKAIGNWCMATTSGDTLNQPEIIAEFDGTYPFVAARAYTFATKVLDADGTTIAGGATTCFVSNERLVTPTAWVANKSPLYAVGDVIKPTVANGHAYRCTAVGTTSDAVEPTWPTTDYGSVTRIAGSPTWVEDGADTGRRIGSYIEHTPCGF